MLKRLAQFIFYGNYFYGCCTVALAFEASMQQNLPPNSLFFYLLLYFGTVLFYTRAYIKERDTRYINNRNKWYSSNKALIQKLQLILLIVCLVLSIVLFIKNAPGLQNISLLQTLPVAFAGFIALSYYGFLLGRPTKINARKTGWLKPFAIGFVWAVAVTYIPVLWYQAEQNTPYIFSRINGWLFIKNFMFISVLAILFDIKDYAADHNKKLKTFVVRVGLRKTIFYIIIPLAMLGFISLVIFATYEQFPHLRIIINSIPFVLLIIVAWSMQRRKPIIYYLAVIDGLMLVKALCGITASLLTK